MKDHVISYTHSRAVSVSVKVTYHLIYIRCYPSISEDIEEVAIRRSGLRNDGVMAPQYQFSRFKDSWIYLLSQPVEPAAENAVSPLPRVVLFSMIILSKVCS